MKKVCVSSRINNKDLPPSTSSDMDNLTCPVCYNHFIAPIYQCHNGHLVCNVCITKLTSCGVCRVLFPKHKIRSLIAEDHVDKSSTQCPNRTNGCQDTFKPAQILKHLRVCEYRLIQVCPRLGFPACDHHFPLKHIVSHLKTVHKVGTVSIQEGQYVKMKQCGLQGAQTGWTIQWPPVILVSEKYPPLILKTKMVTDSLDWTISALHSHEKVAEKLTAKIKLLIMSQMDDKIINSISWKGTISELRTDDDSVHPEAFSLPTSKMRALEHWRLLVKISSETAGKIPGGESKELNIPGRPLRVSAQSTSRAQIQRIDAMIRRLEIQAVQQ